LHIHVPTEEKDSLPEMEALHDQKTPSGPIHAKEERNDPPMPVSFI